MISLNNIPQIGVGEILNPFSCRFSMKKRKLFESGPS